MQESTKSHQKHTFLQKPALGNFSRNELAILGAPCDVIQQLVYTVIEALPDYKIGFADADHKEKNETNPNLPYIFFSNKITQAQVNFAQQPNTIQQRAMFSDADLMLINGNHFKAANQIIVISDAKPLHKKIDNLTNVKLILLDDKHTELPRYLVELIPSVKHVPVLSINNINGIVRFIKTFMVQSTPVLNGLVLCGGESVRMGTDKSGIQYYDGKSQRQHVYGLLQSLCAGVFVSCNATQQTAVELDGLPFITDSFINLGPLGGILSAFRYNPNAAWLIVACDLPYLTGKTLQYLCDKRDISKMATAFASEENNNWPEPLVSIWEPRSYGWLLQLLAQGYSCPRKALINAAVAILSAPEIKEFRNVNEYSDYLETYNNLHLS